ncbi:sigma factor-like helix-turn-helix DNA-binding protein [Spirillospora sp. NPDC047279]|uniref:sigma factor-like helix-turn-helix DNA-binding protein n=1 Tax=Spirillospora sp. NPDC047279 TaxID=3155478 RepID=UPI0033CB1F7A
MALRYGKNAVDEMSATATAPGPAVVARALRSLAPVHREILDQTVFRERSVNEAAASLGVPVDVVKVRVYEALSALRLALSG